MTKSKVTSRRGTLIKRTLAITILCITLILSLTSCNQYGGSSDILTKDELIQNINAQGSRSYDYAAEYFDLWDLPQFNMTKIKIAEKAFRDHCILKLPNTAILAKEAALHFINTYYDGDKAIDLTDKNAVTDALLYSYVYKTGDEYAYYRTPEDTDDFGSDMSGELCGIGISVTRLNDGTGRIAEVFINSGAYRAGIAAGDILVSIDQVLLTPDNQEELFDKIPGEAGTTVDIAVRRGTEILNFTVERSLIEIPTVTYKISDDIDGMQKFGYIKISSFKANTDEQFIEAVNFMEQNGVKGIIFDLRGNPGGFLDSVVNTIDYLIPDRNKIVSYKFKNAPETVLYSKSTHSIKIPTVVLCDKYTASAGELFCAAIKDYGANDILVSSVVGEATYGKGVMQSTLGNLFSDGSSLTLTTAYYNPPSGINYNKDGAAPDGVIPSIAVSDDPETPDTDELYDAGIDELNMIMQMYYGTISKETLLKNSQSYDNNDYKYISSYLRLWRFPFFDSAKLNTVQTIYQKNVNPSINIKSAAKEIVLEFVNNYYDKTDKTAKKAMTAALINSWRDTLDDEYARYLTEEDYYDYTQEVQGTASLGLSYSETTRVITSVKQYSSAQRAGVQEGDIIYAVENVVFTNNYKQIEELITDATKPTVKLTLLRSGAAEPIELTISRSYVYSQSVDYSVVDEVIGYIKIMNFRNDTVEDFKEAMDYMKSKQIAGIIFDLRNNSGGELTQAIGVIEQFARKDAPIVSIDYFNDRLDQTIYASKSASLDIPAVVLCNEHTASAAELFVAAVRDYAAMGHLNAKIIGSEKTYGKGVMQSTQKLPDGTAITYTIAYYNPPSNKNYNKIGIKPDIIESGASAQSSKAIEVIKQLIAGQI